MGAPRFLARSGLRLLPRLLGRPPLPAWLLPLRLQLRLQLRLWLRLWRPQRLLMLQLLQGRRRPRPLDRPLPLLRVLLPKREWLLQRLPLQRLLRQMRVQRRRRLCCWRPRPRQLLL